MPINNYTKVLPGSKQKKQAKYRNEPVEIAGIKFQSTKEGNRYRELKEQERIGLIKHLTRQPRFDIKISEKFIAFYKADFSYVKKGVFIVEDVKSEITAKNKTYRLKKKLVEAIYNIKILET